MGTGKQVKKHNLGVLKWRRMLCWDWDFFMGFEVNSLACPYHTRFQSQDSHKTHKKSYI